MSTWPVGCHSPNSCARHRRCMYIRCRHETEPDLKSDIDKAVATEEVLRSIRQRYAREEPKVTKNPDGTKTWTDNAGSETR